MKRIILAVAVLGVFSFSSCKKEYTCKCQKIYTGNSGSVTFDDGTYTFKDSRPRAEDRCNELEKSGSDLGGEYTRECSVL
ncbi:MAG TPA: hypothetical protein VK177_06470 [Flavobacteriales bacterium]|nr:hypothetical protein [Flavobacteriales bacterium]